MDPLQGETGTWPAAYWYLARQDTRGAPDYVKHRYGPVLILFSSEERAERFHDGFPAARAECEPRAIAVGRVSGLAAAHFRPPAHAYPPRSYLLDPAPEDFDEAGRYVDALYHWPLTLLGLNGYLDTRALEKGGSQQ